MCPLCQTEDVAPASIVINKHLRQVRPSEIEVLSRYGNLLTIFFSTQAIIKIRSSGFDGGSLSVTSSPSAHRDEEQGRLVACWKSSRHVQPITRSHAMDSCDVFVKLLSSTKVVLFFNL